MAIRLCSPAGVELELALVPELFELELVPAVVLCPDAEAVEAVPDGAAALAAVAGAAAPLIIAVPAELVEVVFCACSSFSMVAIIPGRPPGLAVLMVSLDTEMVALAPF